VRRAHDARTEHGNAKLPGAEPRARKQPRKQGKSIGASESKSEAGDRGWPVAAKTEAGPGNALPRERKKRCLGEGPK
jgi:hypothetical protein